MPDILIPIPDVENSFLRFPDGTSDRHIRVYLGTKEGDLFPGIRTSLIEERKRHMELKEKFAIIDRSPAHSQSPVFRAATKAMGGLRGLIGLVLDPEIAEEEFGEELAQQLAFFGGNESLLPGSQVLGAKDPQVAFQEVFGNPRLPFTDTHIFPTAPPPLVDEQTGENKEIQFLPANLKKSFRAGVTNTVIGMVGKAGLEAILPADERGFAFEKFDEPRGALEHTSQAISSLMGRMPEFAIGGAFGGVAGQTGARVVGATALNAGRIERISTLSGALAYSSYIDTIVRDRIDFGRPNNYSESMDRVLHTLEETTKGGLTGVALAGGQIAGGAIFGKAFGVPAGALPASSLRAGLARHAGNFVGGTAVFGTVPPLLEGESPTVEGYYDAAIIMALFAAGEADLAREIARQSSPDARKATIEILRRHGLGELTNELLLPPPRPQPPVQKHDGTTYSFPAEFAQRPPGAFPEPVKPAPEISPRLQEQVKGDIEESLTRAEGSRQADLDTVGQELLRLEGPEATPEALALPRPPEQFIPGGEMVGPRTVMTRQGEVPTGQVDAIQPAVGPVRRPSLELEANVGEFPTGPSPKILRLRERRDLADAESKRVIEIEPTENRPNIDEMRKFREFQESEDLARRRGLEEQPVEPQEVDATGQLEFDIEGIRRDAKSDREALESLVDDLAIIRGKETPEAVFEATARATDLSGEAVTLRRAEARNLAKQIADNEYVASGESIVDVVSVSEVSGDVRVRVRTNEGVEDILDIPATEIGLKGVEEFAEADRRARATIDAAVEGSRAVAEQDGALGKVKETLLSELERLRDEEAGMALFGRRGRITPKEQVDEYTPPDMAQVSRHRLMARYTELTQQVDLLRNALKQPDLSKKDRATIQRRLALKREEQILFSRAIQVAPFSVMDEREELRKMKFNDKRSVAKRMRIKVGKHPTDESLENAIVARRNETRGQIYSVEEQDRLAREGTKAYNDELAAGTRRFLLDTNSTVDWLMSQMHVNHDIIKKSRELIRQHPEMEELLNSLIVETELLRSHSAGGQEALKLNETMYGGLSRSEKNMMDMVIRMRGDIALNNFDPGIKGTYATDTAAAILKNLQAQDRSVFQKVNERADAGFAEYRKLLDLAVEEQLISPADAAHMAEIGEFLPSFYAELVDAKVLGIGPARIPASSPMRRRRGGREVVRPPHDADLDVLIGFARERGAFPKFKKGMTEEARRAHVNALIDQAKAGTEARILDGITLNQKYVTSLYSNAQRNRAGHVLARVAEELPNNGWVKHAAMHRVEGGKLEFDPVEATKEIITYLENGERRGVVVDRHMADAFNLRNQRNAVRAVAGAINFLTLVPLAKATMTGPLNPAYSLIALPRDLSQMRIATPIVGRKTYQSAFPGVAERMILGDFQHVFKDALTKGPLYEEFMAHGGGLHWLAQETVFRRGNKPTDAIRAGYKLFDQRQFNNEFVTGLQNVSHTGIAGAKRFVDTWTHLHSTEEIASRMAEYHRAKINIAEDKGIGVEKLTDADMRMAAVISRSRADFSDGSALTDLAEPVALYFRAGMVSNLSVARTLKGKAKADTAVAIAMLLGAGVAMYELNYSMNPQAMIDAPSWVKTDLLITPPEWLMPTWADDKGNEQHPYIRLAVDQPLSVVNVLSWNVAAARAGHWDNVDTSAAVDAAKRIITFPGYANAAPAIKLAIAQWTDASTWEAGRHIYRGRAGVARAAQVDPTRTAPIAERVGKMLPFISPDILSVSTKDAFGNSLGADIIAWSLNKASGIEDARIKEIKPLYMKMPVMRSVIKDFQAGGSGFADELDRENEETTRRETLEVGFRKQIQLSRMRNNGRADLDGPMREVMKGVSSQIEFDVLMAQLEKEQLKN